MDTNLNNGTTEHNMVSSLTDDEMLVAAYGHIPTRGEYYLPYLRQLSNTAAQRGVEDFVKAMKQRYSEEHFKMSDQLKELDELWPENAFPEKETNELIEYVYNKAVFDVGTQIQEKFKSLGIDPKLNYITTARAKEREAKLITAAFYLSAQHDNDALEISDQEVVKRIYKAAGLGELK